MDTTRSAACFGDTQNSLDQGKVLAAILLTNRPSSPKSYRNARKVLDKAAKKTSEALGNKPMD